MDWKMLLACITGSVEAELLLRNEYLVTENRILRQQIEGRVLLTDAERQFLAEIGKGLGKQHMAVLWATDFFSTEALSRFILFGENALRHVLSEYLEHYHQERCHQGLGNVSPFPKPHAVNDLEGPIQCHERLGGTLKFYARKVA